MARLKLGESVGMSSDEAGQLAARLQERIERLGISVAALARDAKVDRGTVTAMLQSQGVQMRSWAKVNRTLDRLEQEAGVLNGAVAESAAEQPAFVEVEVELPGAPGSARAVVKGTPTDVAEAVAKLLGRLGPKGDET